MPFKKSNFKLIDNGLEITLKRNDFTLEWFINHRRGDILSSTSYDIYDNPLSLDDISAIRQWCDRVLEHEGMGETDQ